MDFSTVWTTLAIGAAASCIALPLGLTMVAVVQRRGWVGRMMLLAMVVLLFFPLFLHVSLWDAAFGKLGWLTSTRGQVLTPIVSGWTAATWIHGVAAAPHVAVIFLLGISAGGRVHEEQALLDASQWQVLVHIKLRRLLPLAGLAISWVIIACAREIAVTDIYRIETLAEQIYLGYSLGAIGAVAGTWSPEQLTAAVQFNVGGSLLPFFILALLLVYRLTRLASPDQATDDWTPAARMPSRLGWSICGWLLLLLLVVIPFSNVLYRCGYAVKPVGGVAVAGFSWGQAKDVLIRACTDFGYEFFWSMTIAAAAATGILTIGIGFAWLARTRLAWRGAFIILVAACMTVPGPMIGTTIAQAFSEVTHPWPVWLYDRTIFAPAVATMVFFWPLAALLIWYLFGRIDQDALASASLDGASPFSRLWHFGVCGNAHALCGCWLITFALCFGELSATQLVLPPGMDTLPRLMLGLLHAGVDEMTAALAIVIGATTMATTLLAVRLGWRWTR